MVSAGGSATTKLGYKKVAPGNYEIEFIGTYPTSISADRLIIIATPKAGGSGIVLAAATPFGAVKSTKITILVQIYSLVNGDNEDHDCYVTIFLGNLLK